MRNIDEIGSNNRLIDEDESYAVIGAAMDVYYRLSCGFLEPVYQEALAYEPRPAPDPLYSPDATKDKVQRSYFGDLPCRFICSEKIIVEIKSQTALIGIDWAQLLNYMKVSSYRVRFAI